MISAFKKLSLLMATGFVLILLAGNFSFAQEQKRVLCSTFPIYLFTKQVAKGADNLKIELLISASLGCPHDYNPTPVDLERLSTADILVVNGLGLEHFLDSALKVTKPALKTIVATQGLTPIMNEMPAGHEADDGHGDHGGPNPHMFANPKLAALMVENIANELAAIDPDGAIVYQRNAALIKASYNSLGQKFVDLGQSFPGLKLVTGHDTFDYMAKDMGFKVVGHIQEIAGAAPSAAQLRELLKTIKTLGAKIILVDPEGDLKLAQTLAKETRLPVAIFDPVASGPVNPPWDYYEQAMNKNLQVLGEILKPKGK